MLLTFTGQVRISEFGLHARCFEKGTEHEVTEEFGARILELFPTLAMQVKKEAPKLETKEGGKLVLKKKTEDEDEE